MGESVDIVVQETGAEQAATNIAAIGPAADAAAAKLDNVNSSIDFLKNAASASTPPLQNLAQAAHSAQPAISGLDNAASAAENRLRAIESAAARAGVSVEEMSRRVAEASAPIAQTAAASEHGAQASHGHAAASDHAAHSSEHLTEVTHILKEALTALGLALSVEKIIEMAEGYEKIGLQLSVVERNAHALHDTEHKLFEISQQTGSSLASNATAYQKLAIETNGLGISQKDLLGVIEGVNTVIRLGGGTAAEASQALNIFGRALATGEVQGRQFRTLLVQFPALGQLVAQGLNEPISALTKFSQKAPLASKDFVEAFNKAAVGVTEAGKKIELQLDSALVTLGNAVLQYIGKLNETSGATQLLAQFVEFLTHHFETLATVVRIGITVWASYFVLLVAIPGIFGAITAAITTLTVAIAANPFGAMIVAVTALIALVYQFGNSIKLTSDGSITVLGALIGTWNVLKNVLTSIWSFVGGPLKTVFGLFFDFVTAPFRLLATIVQGVLNLLEKFVPVAGPIKEAFTAMLAPITNFKAIMVDAMTNATTELNKTGEATKTLAELLGGDNATSLSGAATKASGSMSGLTNSINGYVVGGTQMGRVNAAAIPPFTNLVDQADRAKKVVADAAEQWKKYSAQVDANVAKTEAMALVTRNAMGQMVTSTDEWARRSGQDFNAVKQGADSVTASLERMQAEAQQAASAASQAASSSSSSSSSSTSSSSSAQVMSFQSGQLAGGGDGPSVQGHKTKWNFNGSELLIDWKDDGNYTKDTRPWTNNVQVMGFASGGSFDVGGSGGTDSQLVQFMASPNERVTIETPDQRKDRLDNREDPRRSQKPVIVNMIVHTPDANSFRRSKNQTLLELKSKLNGVGR